MPICACCFASEARLNESVTRERYRQGHGTRSEKKGSTNRKGNQQKRRRLGDFRSCNNCFHAGYSPVFFIHLNGPLSSSACCVIYHNSLVSGISKNFKIKHCETVSLSIVISAASDVCAKAGSYRCKRIICNFVALEIDNPQLEDLFPG